jgi:hypothetical protein
VFERGDETEKAEIIRFYGSKKIKETIGSIENSLKVLNHHK